MPRKITAVAKGEVEAVREQLAAGGAARNAVIEELRAELARLRLPYGLAARAPLLPAHGNPLNATEPSTRVRA